MAAALKETKRALIVVRTYPTPSVSGVEVSCTAAITDRGEWLRLFPVPWRFLEPDERFRKYQWVEASVTKASDARPESYKLAWPDAINILTDPLPTADAWRARKEVVLPLQAHCLCCLQREQKAQGFPTLGVFRPHSIRRLIMEEASPDWTVAQQAALSQGDLFRAQPKEKLEKVPYKFSYEFRCDHPECRSHTLMCADWEMGEAWRKWRNDYGDQWEEKFRQRFEAEMINKYDTYFYVGTVHKHPDAWIIVGLFYPPVEHQQRLF
jgi:hypothetical protein